jgi:DNA-directed RNA polymerase subunit beta'
MIRQWSSGEVKQAKLIDYQSHQPIPGGLLCERIFGPVKDFTCACGRYRLQRYAGIRCERCHVEVTHSHLRRERMGHIELCVPVAHTLFARATPNILATLLGLSPHHLAAVLAYRNYLVTTIHEEERLRLLSHLDATNEAACTYHTLLQDLTVDALLDEQQYRGLSILSGSAFSAGTGAEIIRERLAHLDLDALSVQLRQAMHSEKQGAQKKIIKRLQVVEAFRQSGTDPTWMILETIPVLPADLRPLVPLSGNTFAASDLNILYERILLRNARIKRFLAAGAPALILNQEKRLLQDAVDGLFDNARRRYPTSNSRGQPLKSLSDILKGKYGRFRRNLLGKRVDYSGRSVICAGLDLKLYQCGVPKKMAIELFKPFVMRKLVDRKLAHNIKHAKHMVERRHPHIWDQLAEVMHEKVVLLNRAPTLHRLSIQAFEAVLVEGSAIRLHPLVCSAFNADFDGDQMAIHVPLSDTAQDEARLLLLSSHNLRSPATGEPSISISQEQVLGLYYLTADRPTSKRAGRIFTNSEEALLAYDQSLIDLQTPLIVRIPHQTIYEAPPPATAQPAPSRNRLETTVGRLIFNLALPEGLQYKNYPMTKDALKQIVAECLKLYGEQQTAQMADTLKQLGFDFATRSGISFAMSDITVPSERETLIEQGQAQAQEVVNLYRAGEITYDEWYQQMIEIWTQITDQVSNAARAALPEYGTLMTIVKSGATKAKFQQIRQLSGIRGLMASPSGKILPIPVLSNYYLGLLTWEIFIAASGARKGFMDRSLNTAASGYLTRKLVEAGMEVWITSLDCGTSEGLLMTNAMAQRLGLPDMRPLIVGRVLAEPAATLPAGTLLDEAQADQLIATGQVWVRSPLTCQVSYGLCQQCYGRDLATNKLIRLGVACGIVAGQSIGEPGTQLTMRTFHSGGIANAQGDITQGLPRVSELFEARTPRQPALLARQAGRVEIDRDPATELRTVRIVAESSQQNTIQMREERSYEIPHGRQLLVESGQCVEVGMPLTAGAIDPKVLLQHCGLQAVQRYLVDEVQRVYRNTGVYISDKHLECIVRQMTRYVLVDHEGDTTLLPGDVVDRFMLHQLNAHVLAQGGYPATAHSIVLGLTKAVLQTASWIAAASFQSTNRVLVQATIRRATDFLRGYKERILVGARIPTPYTVEHWWGKEELHQPHLKQ